MIGTKENWTEKNNLRDYPFIVSSGNFPTDAIVDVFVSLWSSANTKPCVTTLSIGTNLISVVFSDETTGEDLFAAVGMAGEEVAVVPASDIDVSGFVKFGNATTTSRSVIQYEAGAISLVNHCFVNFREHTVFSFSSQGLKQKIKGDISLLLSGDFKGEYSNIEEDIIGEETVLEISLNNAGRYKELCHVPLTVCECDEKPIKGINTVLPDETHRNITIESTMEVLEIIATELGVTISALAPTTQICPPSGLPQVGGKLQGEE